MQQAIYKYSDNCILITVLFLAFLWPLKGVAMSFLSGAEAVLFSPMEGVITFEGKPAANAKIIRVVRWKDETGISDEFATDEQGRFSLPVKRESVRIPLLSEFVISQGIHVIYREIDIQIWGRSKRNINLYGELGGNPANLRCELTDDIEYFDMEDGLFGTSCKWDFIE